MNSILDSILGSQVILIHSYSNNSANYIILRGKDGKEYKLYANEVGTQTDPSLVISVSSNKEDSRVLRFKDEGDRYNNWDI